MAFQLKAKLKRVAMGFLAFVLVMFLLEGCCSFALFGLDLYRSTKSAMAEVNHTEYDAELGWVNVPNTQVKDLYGEGIDMKINAQGFRGNHDVAAKVPPGKVRILCSGDSFTLGYGVGNGDTWSHRLAGLSDRIETVNMGQGGYGVDQAFLWYRRERDKFEHQIHLFAFVSTDFDRMRSDSFLGYGKPLLKVTDSKIEIANVPVPERSAITPWMNRNGHIIRDMKLVRAVTGVVNKFRSGPAEELRLGDEDTQKIATAIFRELQSTSAAAGRTLVLVYLPVKEDYQIRKPGMWRTFVRKTAAQEGVLLIDLLDDIQKLDEKEIKPLFIGERDLAYIGAAGHYTPKGNALVAKMLYERLRKLPEVAAKLGE
jgi:hypothetical protein